MMTKDTHFADEPQRFIITTADNMAHIEFPTNVREIETEERTEYVADVYYMRTANRDGLHDEIKNNYEAWLARAMEEPMPKTSLEDVVDAVNALVDIVIGGM